MDPSKKRIGKIKRLYLQLMYLCNTSCLHCFHGEKLEDTMTRLSVEDCKDLIAFFRNHELNTVILLGGEPFLYKDLGFLVEYIKQTGLNVEICTNGYGISEKLRPFKGLVDLLRVSIDGVGSNHDRMRSRTGSYNEALKTLSAAKELGITTGVTCCISKFNYLDLPELAKKVSEVGVIELKLHETRPLGNAEKNWKLFSLDAQDKESIEKITEHLILQYPKLGFKIDSDLLDSPQTICNLNVSSDDLSRAEIEPNGAIYMSCKAVGNNKNAYRFNKNSRKIVFEPTENDEITKGTEQVRYVT
jgi:MoaA/NifB/PqqE/SkfB family radical SAM enzyme